MPMVKRMRKGDLFSMRISACFLYAQIYGRLDESRKEYTRMKFQKLAKDDTPMVRRGAAQSLSILAEQIEKEHARNYVVPLLRSLLQDDNDSVKIMAVYSTATVVNKLLGE
jgi:serine/threonine-protein phosphatase 2A regulatory subunit A